jgi:hypothetical protein
MPKNTIETEKTVKGIEISTKMQEMNKNQNSINKKIEDLNGNKNNNHSSFFKNINSFSNNNSPAFLNSSNNLMNPSFSINFSLNNGIISTFLANKESNENGLQLNNSLSNEKNDNSLSNEKNVSSLSNEKNDNFLSNEENASSLSNEKNVSSLSNEKNASFLSNEENANSLSNEENTNSLSNEENTNSLSNEKKTNSLSNEENTNSLSNEENANSLSNEKNLSPLPIEKNEKNLLNEDKIAHQKKNKRKKEKKTKEQKENSKLLEKQIENEKHSLLSTNFLTYILPEIYTTPTEKEKEKYKANFLSDFEFIEKHFPQVKDYLQKRLNYIVDNAGREEIEKMQKKKISNTSLESKLKQKDEKIPLGQLATWYQLKMPPFEISNKWFLNSSILLGPARFLLQLGKAPGTCGNYVKYMQLFVDYMGIFVVDPTERVVLQATIRYLKKLV